MCPSDLGLFLSSIMHRDKEAPKKKIEWFGALLPYKHTHVSDSQTHTFFLEWNPDTNIPRGQLQQARQRCRFGLEVDIGG